MVRIKLLAAIIHDQKVNDEGTELVVSKAFAREMVSANKAVIIQDAPPSPPALPESPEAAPKKQAK